MYARARALALQLFSSKEKSSVLISSCYRLRRHAASKKKMKKGKNSLFGYRWGKKTSSTFLLFRPHAD